MPNYKDTENNLHFLEDGVDPSSVIGFPQNAVQISDEEAEQIRIEKLPPPDPVFSVKQELLETSQNALKSGVLNVLLYATMTQYLTAIKSRPEAAGLSDAQIEALLTTPGPYYNETYTKTKAYYDQLKSLTDQLP